jgi:tRNA dimethylallyltransferase
LNENPFPNVPPNENLRKKLSKKSPADLLLILKKIDPKKAKIISKSNSERKNARRIIRAIEIASAFKIKYCKRFAGQMVEMTRKDKTEGQRFKVSIGRSDASAQGIERKTLHRYQYAPISIGIKPSVEDLKKRIRTRLKKRLKHGMIAEARRLHGPRTSKNPTGGISWKRMDELGLEYRYLAKYLQGKMSKEEFVEKLNTEIWHYARRQMTWFKRNKKIRWFSSSHVDSAIEIVDKYLNQTAP